MKMNVRLHFLIDSALLEKLKKEADERSMNVSELCRERLREGDRFGVVVARLDVVVERLGRIEEILKTLEHDK